MRAFINHLIYSFLQTKLSETLPGVAKALLKAWTSPIIYPFVVQIEPTRRCNLRCVMCALTQFYHHERTPDMTLDEFKKAVSQFPREITQITIQGTGEPLLHKDIIEMIAFARECGFKTSFNTNLTMLTDEMAERLVAIGLDEIVVSLETLDPARYADIRRNATVDTFLANMEKLAAAKKRAGVEFPKIEVCSILMKHTLQDVPEMVQRMKGYGVVRIHFADLCTYPEHCGPLTMADGSDLRDQSLSATMPKEQVREEIKKIKQLGDDSMVITIPGDRGDLKQEKQNDGSVLTCAELWRLPFVKPDSSLATCCWAPHLVMGNLQEESFQDIWLGKTYRDMRLKHLTNHHPLHCRQCQQLMYTVAKPSSLINAAYEGIPTDDVFLCLSDKKAKKRDGDGQ